MGFSTGLDRYNVPALAAALLTLGLGVFVLIKRPDSPLSRIFAVFSVCLSGWNFGLFMMFLPTGKGYQRPEWAAAQDWAALWDRCLHVALVYLAPVSLHFVLVMTRWRGRWLWRFLPAAYAIATVFMAVALWWPEKFIAGVSWLDYLNGYYPTAGEVSKVFDHFLGAVFLLVMWALWHAYRTASEPADRNRFKLVFFGGLLALSGAAFNVGLVRSQTLRTYEIPPLGHVTTVIFALMLAYAIVKHRLMDINVLIRRGLAYAVLAGLWTGALAALVLGTPKLLERYYGISLDARGMAVIVGLIFAATVVLQEPVVGRIRNAIDRLLFPTAYDYRKALTHFSRTLPTELDIDVLRRSIVSEISETMGIERTALVLRDSTAGAFPMVSVAGEGGDELSDITLDPTDPLLQVLRSQGRELLRSDLLGAAIGGDGEGIEATMSRLGAALCVPLVSKGELIGALVLGQKLSREVYNDDDISLLSIVAREAAIALENATLYDQMQEYLFSTIEALAAAVEAKDAYTSGHCRRVAEYAVMIGRAMGVGERLLDALRAAGILHDVGKIGVPDEILTKRTALTQEEFALIKKHPEMGVNILGPVGLSPEAILAVRHHHERVDGTGYVAGLAGGDIPLVARILAVADAFEAMTSDRSYRSGMSEQMALSELIRCAGTQFDVKVVEAFLLARDLRITGADDAQAKEDRGPRLRAVEAA